MCKCKDDNTITKHNKVACKSKMNTRERIRLNRKCTLKKALTEALRVILMVDKKKPLDSKSGAWCCLREVCLCPRKSFKNFKNCIIIFYSSNRFRASVISPSSRARTTSSLLKATVGRKIVPVP